MRKKWMVVVMVGMLFLFGCSGSDTPTNALTPDINIYSRITARYEFIGSAEEMVKAATIVYTATVTDISFEMVDMTTALPPDSESDKDSIRLHTIYHVDIITLYKGEKPQSTFFMVPYGVEAFQVEKQQALIKEYDQEYIPLLINMPEIKIGKDYLFMLWQYQDSRPTLMNPSLSLYNLEDPFEEHPSMTAKEIISTFGKDQWNTFWSQWQKDNPGWENRLDKASVEKALAED